MSAYMYDVIPVINADIGIMTVMTGECDRVKVVILREINDAKLLQYSVYVRHSR